MLKESGTKIYILVPVPETFKAFTPKLKLKIRCLIWVNFYIVVRFVVNNGIKISSFLSKYKSYPNIIINPKYLYVRTSTFKYMT